MYFIIDFVKFLLKFVVKLEKLQGTINLKIVAILRLNFVRNVANFWNIIYFAFHKKNLHNILTGSLNNRSLNAWKFRKNIFNSKKKIRGNCAVKLVEKFSKKNLLSNTMLLWILKNKTNILQINFLADKSICYNYQNNCLNERILNCLAVVRCVIKTSNWFILNVYFTKCIMHMLYVYVKMLINNFTSN